MFEKLLNMVNLFGGASQNDIELPYFDAAEYKDSWAQVRIIDLQSVLLYGVHGTDYKRKDGPSLFSILYEILNVEHEKYYTTIFLSDGIKRDKFIQILKNSISKADLNSYSEEYCTELITRISNEDDHRHPFVYFSGWQDKKKQLIKIMKKLKENNFLNTANTYINYHTRKHDLPQEINKENFNKITNSSNNNTTFTVYNITTPNDIPFKMEPHTHRTLTESMQPENLKYLWPFTVHPKQYTNLMKHQTNYFTT